MRLCPEVLEISDPEAVAKKIADFIRDYVTEAGAKGVVLGISGGVDSSVVAALCSIAFNNDRNKVLGLIMPERETYNASDIEDAKKVANQFKIECQIIDITPIIQVFRKILPAYDPKDRVSDGNMKARARMCVLYYYANKLRRLVVGTGDKTETILGYYTKYGDGASDISPIRGLFKTQVRQLAAYLELPKTIVTKPSTPALWPGQTAEQELPARYEILDLILFGLQRSMHPEEIVSELQPVYPEVTMELIDKIEERRKLTEHKRQLPITLDYTDYYRF